MHCEGAVCIATTNHFCFWRFISAGKTWISLGQSPIDIVLDGISPFAYTSNPPLLTVISFLYGVLKPGRLSCAVGKELSHFVLLITRKSTCVHTNFDKASSLFLTELMLIYDKQTFFGCFSRESLKMFFVFAILAFVHCVGAIGISIVFPCSCPNILRINCSRVCIIV